MAKAKRIYEDGEFLGHEYLGVLITRRESCPRGYWGAYVLWDGKGRVHFCTLAEACRWLGEKFQRKH